MPKAVIDADRCQPDACPGGRCAARGVCPTRAILQLEPHEPPAADPQRCRGCAKCPAACPRRAIQLA